MKIAIYARVSSDTQAKEGTIESQIEALREYAKAHHLEVSYECLDDGFSGTTLDRPGLDQVRDLAQAGDIEGVLILSPDRLSRKQANQIILIEEFKKRDITVIFTNQQFDDTPEGNFMLQIQGAVAELERAKIIDRTRRGAKHALKNGQVNGGNAPYGYRHVNKTKTTKAHWEVDPHEAEIVRKVYQWYTAEGMKIPAIIKRLEAEGLYSRSSYRKWWASSIYAILKNETYTGMAYMNKTRWVEPAKNPKIDKYRKRKKSTNVSRPKDEWIGIPVPQIIDRKTWETAQTLLKKNSIMASRNNTKNQYALRGLVICGLCGCMAGGHVSNNKTYYGCGAKRYKNLTSKPHDENIIIRHEFLDDNVWKGLVELLNDPANLQKQMARRMIPRTARPNRNEGELGKYAAELEKLDIQEKRIIDAYREQVISLTDLKEQKALIAERRKHWEAMKKAALRQQEGAEQPKITMQMLGDVSARFHRVMAKADFAKRQQLLNLLVDAVALHPRKAVITGKIPVNALDALNPRRYASPLQFNA